MPFATNSDLVQYFPTAMDHGVADWTADLLQAQGDIETLIKIRWFNIEFGTINRQRFTPTATQYNPVLLTSTQWTRAACYRALACYILPKLSTFRPEGDAFREQLAFYSSRFDDELALQIGSGVLYDVNADGVVAENESFPMAQDRLFR